VDWKAANLFWRGISPYSPEGLEYVGVTDFGHPPTTPFWVLPLADLDHTQFAAFIGTLNLGMALALVAIVVYALGFPMPALVTALVFGVVESRPTALEHFRVIQISVWIAFAYALAWRWLRTGQDVKAGLALGCACTLKLFPALMVVFLLLERRWRAVATMGGAFLAVAAIMTWRWGLGAWTSFFEQQGPIAARALLDWRNASIHGVIRRAFNDVCLRGSIHDFAPTLVIWLVAVASLGAAVWLWRRAHQHQPA
jgi:alpha-1,2-mannosyltransferase